MMSRRAFAKLACLPKACPTAAGPSTVYVVAIAWLYVVLLMSLTERSAAAGIATFVFYGVAPLALFLWLVGTPQRRRRQRSARPPPDPEQ